MDCQAILFDLDGVLYEGDRPVPGAAEAVAAIRARGVPHLFLTNTSSRPRGALVEKLAGMGIPVAETDLFTPPVAARAWLETHGYRAITLFVPEATRGEFQGLPLSEGGTADAVVVGDLGMAWDFQTLNRAFRLLMANPDCALVALGLTRYWRAEDGLQLDVGPFVKALEYATGRSAVVMGKPAAPFFEAALERLGTSAQEAVMVGDDIRGDIEAAQKLGLRGVLVRTGKFRPADLESGVTPAAVIDSVADLPRLCSDRP